MSLLIKKGSWTGNNTSPQSITAVGFQPKALIVFTTAPGAASSFQPGAFCSVGVATRRGGTTQQGYVALRYADAVATTAGSVNGATSALLEVLISSSGATDYTVSLSSFDSDGFTVTYSSAANANGDIFHYIALGGTDLVDANVIAPASSWPTSGATFDVTGFGFQPEALFTLVLGTNGIGFGFMDTAGAAGSVCCTFTTGDTMTSGMNNNNYVSHTGPLSLLTSNADTLEALADFNSWLSDGVRFDNTNAPASARTPVYLGLKGGQYEVVNWTKNTGSGDQAITTSFQPKGVITICADDAVTADSVNSGVAGIGLGASTATDTTQEGAFCTAIGEAINTQADRIHIATKNAIIPSVSASSTQETSCTLNAWSSTSFTVSWQLAATAEVMSSLVIGDALVTPKAPPPYRKFIRQWPAQTHAW